MISEFFKRRWKSVLGAFLIAVGVDALVNSQLVISSLPSQMAETFQFYKEPATKIFPTYLFNLINWPFYTVALIGTFFILWDIDFLRKRKKEVGEIQ
jgi:hypothetical protein